MSGSNVLEGQDDFSCSVCLDLMTDPVTLSCGHSFCMSCINAYWNQQTGVFSCPQCRETFYERPVLRSNKMLAEALGKLRKAGSQVSPPCYATPGDVECDICTGRKCKAIKSCLVCLASYCEVHFQPHEDSAALKKHTVTEASGQLHELICSQHGKPLEIYCQTDQKCVCYLCTMDEHSGHKTVLIGAERAEKQKQAKEMQSIYKQRIQQREMEHLELIESMNSVKRFTQVAVENTEQMFRELILSIEKKCFEETELIRALEKDVISQAETQLMQVEQEIVDFRRKDDELQQLSQIENEVFYLQKIQTFHVLSLYEDLPKITMNTPYFCEHVKTFVHSLQEQTVSFKHCSDSISQSNPFAEQPKRDYLSEGRHIFGFGAKPPLAAKSRSDLSFTTTTVLPATCHTAFSFGPLPKVPLSVPHSHPTVSFPSHVASGPLYSPASKYQSAFSFGSSVTETQPSFGCFGVAKKTTEFFGFTPTTDSQPSFSWSAQKTTPESRFLFGSTPATAADSQPSFSWSAQKTTPESRFLFGFTNATAADSQPTFSWSAQNRTPESHFLFGTPAGESKSTFSSTNVFSKPDAEAQPTFSVFGSIQKSADKSQNKF